MHEGSQVAKLLEGAEKAQSPQKTIVVSAPDARGTRYLSARSTNGVLRSIGDLLSGPDGPHVLQDVLSWIQHEPGPNLTVEHLKNVIYQRAIGHIGLAKAAQLSRDMFNMTGDPHVASSRTQWSLKDSNDNDVMLRSDVVDALENLLYHGVP